MMVQLNWKSPTGKTGCGTPITKIEADAWLEYLNKKYPDFSHWLTKVSAN